MLFSLMEIVNEMFLAVIMIYLILMFMLNQLIRLIIDMSSKMIAMFVSKIKDSYKYRESNKEKETCL